MGRLFLLFFTELQRFGDPGCPGIWFSVFRSGTISTWIRMVTVIRGYSLRFHRWQWSSEEIWKPDASHRSTWITLSLNIPEDSAGMAKYYSDVHIMRYQWSLVNSTWPVCFGFRQCNVVRDGSVLLETTLSRVRRTAGKAGWRPALSIGIVLRYYLLVMQWRMYSSIAFWTMRLGLINFWILSRSGTGWTFATVNNRDKPDGEELVTGHYASAFKSTELESLE
jgi:hypothetical protein